MGVSRTSWFSVVTPRYQFQTGSGGARQRRQGVWCGGKALAWRGGGRRGRSALLVQNGELCVMGRKKLRNTGIQREHPEDTEGPGSVCCSAQHVRLGSDTGAPVSAFDWGEDCVIHDTCHHLTSLNHQEKSHSPTSSKVQGNPT